MRDLAILALADVWDGGKALELGDPADTIVAYEAGLRPLIEIEPELNGPESEAVRQWLKPIGMKMRPDMTDTAKSEWLTAVMMALSDLPPKTAASAARAALRVPMKFLGDVDGVVREEAGKIMDRHKRALHRLRMMQREIANASQPKLEAPEGHNEPMTIEEIKTLARSPVSHLVALGLASGAIRQEDHDAAMAQLEGEA